MTRVRAPRDRRPSPKASGISRTSRRRLLILGALAAAGIVVTGAVLFGPGAFSHSSAGTRPNVLLITIDTLRWDHLGCYGSRTAATPVLDRLAAGGARFETAIM